MLAGRRASEGACRSALDGLGVFLDRRPEHLSDEQAALRNSLRAKWRQLGNDNELLVSECSYEQWHRLLFARFLAENSLLLHPQFKAPVTLEDCEDLAAKLGESDGWAVAARFAAEILPGIFRFDDPCVRLRLAPEGKFALEEIITELPAEVFAADDALGWVYQFWQKDKKDEINASERKIGGADLGPVTQLFTENYMVRFLLENSLGAWWASHHPGSPLVKGFEYLRFDEDGKPAAGAFDSWPKRVAEVTVMDPCCGSGHFLVEAFGMLWQMRAEEEGLTLVDAQDAVLRDNLFGLELDSRCVQIAMFAVALQAWKAGGGWRQLPVPNIACSGIPVKAPLEEWKKLAGGDPRLENALVRLHSLFRNADTLGSLIDPRRAAEIADPTGIQRSLEDVDWDDVGPLLGRVLLSEHDDPAATVLGADAAGLSRAADHLSRSYSLVATNPPFLGRGKQEAILRSRCDSSFPDAAADLATVMLRRCSFFCVDGGVSAFVLPDTWRFIPSYAELREAVVAIERPRLIAGLGPRAFRTQLFDYPICLMISVPSLDPSENVAASLARIEVRRTPNVAAALRNARVFRLGLDVRGISTDPESADLPMLGEFARPVEGLSTGDGPRYLRKFWEQLADRDWEFLQVRPDVTKLTGGAEEVFLWEEGSGVLASDPGARIQGQPAWGRAGILVERQQSLRAALYLGTPFFKTTVAVIAKDQKLLPAIWAFCSSTEYVKAVRRRDPRVGIATSSIVDVPFDVERWRDTAEREFPHGLPEPWSDDPTQWLFGGRPEVSTAPLQVAVGRLLGYRWPEQSEGDDLNAFGDDDGIVCLPSVAGEPAAVDRLQQLLAAAFGKSWTPAKVKELLEKAGSKKKSLADWLRDEFFTQHCALFENRPFVWHIWDGQKDGFSALVNYHRLNRQTLERLTYTYLGQDWVERQRAGVRDDVPGAESRLAAALVLQQKLEAILEGENPFDVYVRWKQLHEQPIGWEPDLNDGVRLNIRPFVEAGVLRAPFNIDWKKDRGRNPDGSERFNHLHLSLAEKVEARRKAGRS